MLPVIVGALVPTILGELARSKQKGKAMDDEYVGDDDLEALIAGDDDDISGDDDEVGAKVKKVIRKLAKGGGMLGIIPVTSASVGAGATGTTEVKAVGGEWFKVIGLVVDDDIAGDFFISDIKIGNKPIFLSDGEIAATMFKQSAVNKPTINSQTVKSGGVVVLKTRNASAGALVFNGALIVRVVKPGTS